MLDGSFEAITDAEIVAHVLANPLDDLTDTSDPTDPDTDGDGGKPDSDGGQGGGGDGGKPDNAGAEPGGGELGGGEADSDGLRSADPVGGASSAGSAAGSGCAVPELRVQLVTLLGQTDAPGELPGWDYLPPALARRLADTMRSARWRWVVCDEQGRPIDAGLTSARPTTPDDAREPDRFRRDPRRGGIVELAIRETDLQRLAEHSDQHAGWAPVITEIHRQYLNRDSNGVGTRRSGPRPEADQARAGRWLPGSPLRRWIEIRDRTCQHPACRVSAHASQIDHRIGWAVGGATVAANLGPACAHDHRIKDRGGWQFTGQNPA